MLLRDPETTTLYYPQRSNWDDLRFPTYALKVPAQSDAPLPDPDDGNLLFTSTKDSMVTGFAQIPHDWWKGRAMKPHVHFECMDASAGNISMKVDYKMANIGELFPAAWTEVQVIIPANGVPLLHDIFGNALLDLTGYRLSAGIKFRVWRLGATGAGAYEDTYDADWKLLEYDLHYERDKVGSGEEYSI
jgi:hypothetical protein